jgi:hypothetical protein
MIHNGRKNGLEKNQKSKLKKNKFPLLSMDPEMPFWS